jgi:transposase
MLEETQDDQEIIERMAALDIGKEELVCCARVPDPKAVSGGPRKSPPTPP